jgi:hypothetical protein
MLPRPTTTGPVVNWMQQLHQVYDLADGEIVKFVPRPFIPDRVLYVQSYMPGVQLKSVPGGPDVLVFDYENHNLRGRAAMYADGNAGDVAYAIASVAQVDRGELAIPAQILSLPMKGDWVYRLGSTPQQRMAAIGALIGKQLQQPDGKLMQQAMERDAIVVSGSYAFQPLAQADHPHDTSAPPPIYLFRGDSRPGKSRGGGKGDLTEFCNHLAATCDRPVVIETSLPAGVTVHWQNCLYFTVRPGDIGMGDADVDSVIANVAKQTSLQIKREKRTVPTWVWQKGG